MKDKILQIEKLYLAEIKTASKLAQLDDIFLKLFGKNGEVTAIPSQFSTLPKDELKEIGPLFNQVKSTLETEINKRRGEIREESYEKLDEEIIDISKPLKLDKKPGHLHPISKFEHEIVELFKKLGFSQFDAPHIDTDYYNFGALNIPEDHPARDLWDTLHISKQNLKVEENLILRTHTSNAQIRIMEQFKTPIKKMVFDRCFRYENLDARHEHTFEQFELVYIDKGLNMSHLQYLSEYFLKTVLGKDTKVRLKPKYYPFVEPGVGIDGTCLFCGGKGCKVCGGIGWLELGGAGMIHPKVLENGGIDPKIYTGIAWGPGLGRILMLKEGIEDVRLFKSGDLRFLSKF